jgi:YidC/Oxa1 family membrane protein insertase
MPVVLILFPSTTEKKLMSEPTKQTPSNPKPADKKAKGIFALSDEQRMLVAFLLMGLVLVGTQYFLPQQPTPAAKKTPPPVSTAATDAPKAAGTAAMTAPPVATATPVRAERNQLVTIDTPLLTVALSNQGAVAESWVLKKYKDSDGKPLQLIHRNAAAKAGWPFSVIPVSGAAPLPADPNSVLYAVERSADGLSATFRYNDGRLSATKTFRFYNDRYTVDVTTALSSANAPVAHRFYWRGGFGDFAAANAPTLQMANRMYGNTDKVETLEGKKAAEGWLMETNPFVFAGMADAYFACVALNRNNRSFDFQMTGDNALWQGRNGSNKEEAWIGAGWGGAGANELTLFVGPKDRAVLKQEDPRLLQLADWGMFRLIAEPLFSALMWLNNNWVRNFGWSIILLTIIINVLLLPLKFSSMKSMKKTAALQPRIQAINKKYEGLKMTDPKMNNKQAEIMELYKEAGVSPVGGCLPLFIQLPFLVGFFEVLSVAIELRQQSWYWVPDLTQPEQLAIRILPLLMIATQIYSQKITPTTGMDPAQARMMLLMPLMFGFMFWSASSGLVLYWLTGNVFAIAQQFLFNRFTPAPVAAPVSTKGKGK